MIYFLSIIWILCALFCLLTRNPIRIVVYLGIFSTLSAVCFFVLGAPDVAMAETAVSSFATIFLIVSFEKYFSVTSEGPSNYQERRRLSSRIKRNIVPLSFTLLLIGLFIYFIPDVSVNTYLRDLYLAGFQSAVGGENAVTSIYLGYRAYDTLFEALMLLVSVVAATHMSCYTTHDETDVHIEGGPKPKLVDIYTIRIICPLMLLFGIYLVFNGHISPGGGFQGGVAIASFFICRFILQNIYDLHVTKVLALEKLVFAAIVMLAIGFIFLGVYVRFPEAREVYLIMMNLLIAMKVACGFVIIFYRYVAYERR